MILTLRRTGGFAGLQETLARVDSRDLGDAAQRTLAAQVEALARAVGGKAPEGADQVHWEVEIREAGQPIRTLVVVEDGNPGDPGLRALAALTAGLGLAVP